MPVEADTWSRRDSWPPTQVRLSATRPTKSADPRPLLDIDDDPLTYFLTPTTEEDEDDFDGDFFDAGIEDSNYKTEIVRSVSPSSLNGFSKPSAIITPSVRAASPDSDIMSPDEDEDDEEEYIRFGNPSNAPQGLLTLRDLAIDSLRYRPRTPRLGRSANALLSPTFTPPSVLAAQKQQQHHSRGRSQFRSHKSRSLSASATMRPRPHHLWREPSPDVWSIEEETEEELMSEMGGSSVLEDDGAVATSPSGKPKKKVRFILPSKEE